MSRQIAQPPGHRQSGFTVVELLVSAVVGLLIVAGILGLFVTNRRVFTETDSMAELQENGRFALEYLLNDLRHAGFFGQARFFSLVRSADGLSSVTGDCSGNAAAYGIELPIWGTEATSANALTCISDALVVSGIPSDILVVRSAVPMAYLDTDDSGTVGDTEDNNGDGQVNSADRLQLGRAYIGSNVQQGEIFSYDASHPLSKAPTVGASGQYPDGAIWEYSYSAFYIRDNGSNPPTLARKRLQTVSGVQAVVMEDLVEGIEGLRLLYGFDSDFDGVADRYVAHSDVAADQWTEVVSVKAFVLARSLRPNRAYTDERTYVMGDTDVTATSGTDASQGAALQNFQRTLNHSTVDLRNMQFVGEEG